MTRSTNARLAGSMFLLYMAMGISTIVLSSPMAGAEKLAAIAEHAPRMRLAIVLSQLAGFLKGPVTSFMWLPMLVFEVVLALWLLIKGVATPAPHRSAGETA